MVSSRHSPKSSALPVSDRPSVPGKASGNRVMTLAVQAPLTSARFLHQVARRSGWPGSTGGRGFSGLSRGLTCAGLTRKRRGRESPRSGDSGGTMRCRCRARVWAAAGCSGAKRAPPTRARATQPSRRSARRWCGRSESVSAATRRSRRAQGLAAPGNRRPGREGRDQRHGPGDVKPQKIGVARRQWRRPWPCAGHLAGGHDLGFGAPRGPGRGAGRHGCGSGRHRAAVSASSRRSAAGTSSALATAFVTSASVAVSARFRRGMIAVAASAACRSGRSRPRHPGRRPDWPPRARPTASGRAGSR